jgi:hypothetical protein
MRIRDNSYWPLRVDLFRLVSMQISSLMFHKRKLFFWQTLLLNDLLQPPL